MDSEVLTQQLTSDRNIISCEASQKAEPADQVYPDTSGQAVLASLVV